MNDRIVYLWKSAPFIRLLLVLTGGIVLQWYLQTTFFFLSGCLVVSASVILTYSLLPIALRYKYSIVNGISIHLLIITTGALLTQINDIRNDKNWIGHLHTDNSFIIATLQEPLVEKANSFKALANMEVISNGTINRKAKGKILLYFKKDSVPTYLHYGSKIIFLSPLQTIKNSGNPGSFDYKQYCLFKGITHQAYLTLDNYRLLSQKETNDFWRFIYRSQDVVVKNIRNNIKSNKESGMAEALLIGYKDDLDKSLVQSYTNTGVIHIIAISGMHLSLIYGLLLFFTRPFKKQKYLNGLGVLIVITGLWAFSMLTGAQPSILRSAVMFSCIALAGLISRRTTIYNSLALSAFVLLCYDPFWLWDAG